MSSPYKTPCTPMCDKYSRETAHLCDCEAKQKYLALKEKMRNEKAKENDANEHVGNHVIGPKVRRNYQSWEVTSRKRSY